MHDACVLFYALNQYYYYFYSYQYILLLSNQFCIMLCLVTFFYTLRHYTESMRACVRVYIYDKCDDDTTGQRLNIVGVILYNVLPYPDYGDERSRMWDTSFERDYTYCYEIYSGPLAALKCRQLSQTTVCTRCGCSDLDSVLSLTFSPLCGSSDFHFTMTRTFSIIYKLLFQTLLTRIHSQWSIDNKTW